jgi:putative DNA primase/helicase
VDRQYRWPVIALNAHDLIQAEHKFGAAFQFTPWALPVYSANKAFGSSDSSEGWVSRWIVVPFPNTFTGTEDRGLDNLLHTDSELRGITCKGIAGLPELIKRGRFQEPKSVQQAKTEFVAASDAVRSFITEYTTPDAEGFELRTELYQRYRVVVFSHGWKTLSAREFYQRVGQISGIVATHRDGYHGFKGIELKTDESAGSSAGLFEEPDAKKRAGTDA